MLKRFYISALVELYPVNWFKSSCFFRYAYIACHHKAWIMQLGDGAHAISRRAQCPRLMQVHRKAASLMGRKGRSVSFDVDWVWTSSAAAFHQQSRSAQKPHLEAQASKLRSYIVSIPFTRAAPPCPEYVAMFVSLPAR